MKKFFLISLLLFSISKLNSQGLVRSVPFLKKNGFYTLVKYGTKTPIIEKNYQGLEVFSKSHIKFFEDDKYGLLNMEGKVQLPNYYKEINLISDNLIELVGDNGKTYLDSTFKVVDESLTKDLYKIKDNEIFDLPIEYYKFLVDTTKFIFEKSENEIKVTNSYGREVKGKMSYLYIDKKTNNIFFNCEIVEVSNENLIDNEGNDILDRYGRKIKNEKIISSGILLLKSNGDYISQYTQVKYLGLNLYSVSKNSIIITDEWGRVQSGVDKFYVFGIIDGNGNKITPLKYIRIDPFNSGLSLVILNDNPEGETYEDKYFSGFVNTKGELVIPMKKLNRNDGFSEGLVLDISNNNISFLDTTGKTSFTLNNDFKLLNVGKQFEDKYQYNYRNFKNGLLFVSGIVYDIDPKTKEKIGTSQICLINNKGKVLKCGNWGNGYDPFPSPFYNGYSLIKNKKDKYGIIDEKGNDILSPKSDYIYRYCGEIIDYEFVNENFLSPKNIFSKVYLSYIYDPQYEHHVRKVVLNNLLLVKESSNIFYVDINGFEYIEK